jgi:hypothetical protein
MFINFISTLFNCVLAQQMSSSKITDGKLKDRLILAYQHHMMKSQVHENNKTMVLMKDRQRVTIVVR